MLLYCLGRCVVSLFCYVEFVVVCVLFVRVCVWLFDCLYPCMKACSLVCMIVCLIVRLSACLLD